MKVAVGTLSPEITVFPVFMFHLFLELMAPLFKSDSILACLLGRCSLMLPNERFSLEQLVVASSKEDLQCPLTFTIEWLHFDESAGPDSTVQDTMLRTWKTFAAACGAGLDIFEDDVTASTNAAATEAAFPPHPVDLRLDYAVEHPLRRPAPCNFEVRLSKEASSCMLYAG